MLLKLCCTHTATWPAFAALSHAPLAIAYFEANKVRREGILNGNSREFQGQSPVETQLLLPPSSLSVSLSLYIYCTSFYLSLPFPAWRLISQRILMPHTHTCCTYICRYICIFLLLCQRRLYLFTGNRPQLRLLHCPPKSA